MLDTSTFYLILMMVGFIYVAIVVVHQHSNADKVRRKQAEIEHFTMQVNKKMEVIEQEVVDLKIKIDELDEEIESFKQ